MATLTDTTAQTRAITKVDDGTWVEAFWCRNEAGAPAVRFLRKADVTGLTSVSGTSKGGAWDEATDDSTT
jgi:hypothetical protein